MDHFGLCSLWIQLLICCLFKRIPQAHISRTRLFMSIDHQFPRRCFVGLSQSSEQLSLDAAIYLVHPGALCRSLLWWIAFRYPPATAVHGCYWDLTISTNISSEDEAHLHGYEHLTCVALWHKCHSRRCLHCNAKWTWHIWHVVGVLQGLRAGVGMRRDQEDSALLSLQLVDIIMLSFLASANWNGSKQNGSRLDTKHTHPAYSRSAVLIRGANGYTKSSPLWWSVEGFTTLGQHLPDFTPKQKIENG